MVAWVALGVSVVALGLSALQFINDRGRTHREMTPEVICRWTDEDTPRLSLILTRDATDDPDKTASVWLPHGMFLNDEGEQLGDHTELDHPWPVGWTWALPQIAMPGQATGPLSVVVTLKAKRWKPWNVTLQVDPPQGKPFFFVY